MTANECEAGHSDSSPQRPGARIAVLARPQARAQVSKLLSSADLSFDGYDDVDSFLDGAPARPAAAVLWIDDDETVATGLIKPLAHRLQAAPLVLVCAQTTRWGVRAALAAGAAAVVLAEVLDTALLPSLSAAQAGQICVPREHSRQIEPPSLSTREKQILGLLVMGYTNGQIAEQLYVAESTVKSHLSSAFGKLGVRSRNDAVKLILDPERGWGMGILSLGGEPVSAESSDS